MGSLIRRSFSLSFFAVLWTSLIAALCLLGLNDRFIDSAVDGWILFLLIPIAVAVPVALVVLLLYMIPPKDGEAQAGRFLGLFLSLLIVPAAGFLLHWEFSGFFTGSTVVIVLGTILTVFILLIGAVRIGQILARRVCVSGTPRMWSIVLPALLLLLLPLFGSWLSGRPIPFDGKQRTLMLCVDGARWDLVDRFDALGMLPTFRSLQKEGSRFEMESFEPLMSPVIWTTIASGVRESVHDVHNFFATYGTVKAPRIWEIAEQRGMSVGTLGWLVTWPPKKVNGFMIPSLFARGPETYPEELRFIREIAMSEKSERKREPGTYVIYAIRSVQYGVKLSTLREAARVMTRKGDFLEKLIAKRYLKLLMHRDIFLELWERYQPEFAAFYDNGVDITCHHFWKYFEPEGYPDVTAEEVARYGNSIPNMYQSMDRALAEILRFAPDDANIVLVSDHGLRGMEVQDSGTIRIIRTENLLRRLGLDEMVEGINLARRVHLRGRGERGMLPAGLGSLVESITLVETGEPVFSISKKDPVSLIVRVRSEPRLSGNNLLLPNGGTCPVDELVEETFARISGEHSPDAVLVLKGENMRKGFREGVATILDVAPTTLYMMGLPIGRIMEGRLLESAFVEGYVRNNPPQYAKYDLDTPDIEIGTEDSENILKEQLRGLGYLN